MANKILVVDDERVILDLTTMILRSKGYEVITAENGQLGIELVGQETPDLVLMDYMMPGMDGMTALRAIKDSYPDTYVIMFTGKGSEEVAVELMKAGASDYILKPFNNLDMVDRIENVLKIRRIELLNKELRKERERLLQEIEEWNRELERRVEEKSRQLEQAHAEILMSEKLAALGHISAGLAHEIRNPLHSISLFTQVLREGIKEDTERLPYIEKILGEVDRIDNILVKLLDASKGNRIEKRAVSIAEIIDQALATVRAQAETQQVEIVKRFDRQPPPIQADASEISQIFSNLFLNALQAMDAGGRISVVLTHDESDIRIDISDTGRGIPQDDLKQIFDPFFTTKTRGTGFGLSVVLRIVKTYGGRISVESHLGEGTVFHIRLPMP